LYKSIFLVIHAGKEFKSKAREQEKHSHSRRRSFLIGDEYFEPGRDDAFRQCRSQ
jgi:hypothetical protein